MVAQIVKDELRHAAVMYGLLADLGFDVDSHVRRHDETFTMRIDANADIGTARITDDKRVNIFYYPIDTWADFIFFNFCMDRGAGHQLEDVRAVLLRPLGARHRGDLQGGEVPHPPRRVLGQEAGRGPRHPRRGPDDVRQVVRPHDEHLRPPRLTRRTRSTGRYKLKLRDNDEVRQAFATEVAGPLREVRARPCPAWKPVWAELPEEAQIPG